MLFFVSGKNQVGKNTFMTALGKAMQSGPSWYAGGQPILIDTAAPVKAACSLLGWDGNKTPPARQLLADVYVAANAFNHLPVQYLLNRIEVEPFNSVFVVMVRQYNIVEIMKENLRRTSVDHAYTVQITRQASNASPVNEASEPAEVENEFAAAFPKDYHDFVLHNDGTIEEFWNTVSNMWRELNGMRGRNLFPQQ
jgi:hypothetical protein